MEPDFLDMALNSYLDIIQHFRNGVLLKVSTWVIGQFTSRIYERDKETEVVDRSVQALIQCANSYIQQTQIISMIVTSLMKLTQLKMTTKHIQIKQFMKKLQSSKNYFIHKIASQFICNAKYGKALSCSNQIQIDYSMSFLNQYADNQEQKSNKFEVSRKNLIKKPIIHVYNQEYQTVQDTRMLNNQSYQDFYIRNVFQFRPGSRWGNKRQVNDVNQTQANLDGQATQLGMVRNDMNGGKKGFNLRGPREGQKSKNSNKQVDEKKMNLAKSLFGGKKKK